MASFNLKKDTVVEKHYHPSQDRSIKTTSEVIVVLEGQIQVDIYDEDLKLIENQLVSKGETMAMFAGGHGITVIEDCKLIETKQGPFDEETDKIPRDESLHHQGQNGHRQKRAALRTGNRKQRGVFPLLQTSSSSLRLLFLLHVFTDVGDGKSENGRGHGSGRRRSPRPARRVQGVDGRTGQGSRQPFRHLVPLSRPDGNAR